MCINRSCREEVSFCANPPAGVVGSRPQRKWQTILPLKQLMSGTSNLRWRGNIRTTQFLYGKWLHVLWGSNHKVGLCYSNKVSHTSKNPTHPASTWSHCKPQSRKYPHKLEENEISSSGRKYTFMRAIWSVTAVCAHVVDKYVERIHTHSCMMWGEID